MAVGDAHVFPGSLTPVLRQLQKLPTAFLTCFRFERRKYAEKKVCLNQVSNSQPPGHKSNTLITEPSLQGKSVDHIFPLNLLMIHNPVNDQPLWSHSVLVESILQVIHVLFDIFLVLASITTAIFQRRWFIHIVFTHVHSEQTGVVYIKL